MDFRLPHPVTHSIKKKKRRWKLLGGETKKLSLKNYKKNASCQTDSSDSSGSSTSKGHRCRISSAPRVSRDSSVINDTNKENFRGVESERGNKNLLSIYNYCTPGIRCNRKDSPVPLKSFSSLNPSRSLSNLENMSDNFDLIEANYHFLPSLKHHKARSSPKGRRSKPVRKIAEDPLFSTSNVKLTVSNVCKTSSETVGNKKTPESEDNNAGCVYPSSAKRSVPDLNEKSNSWKSLQSTIVLSDSDSSHHSNKEPEKPVKSTDENFKMFDLDKTTSSDTSQIILESSISPCKHNTSMKNEKDLLSGQKTLIRSSVLNRRFNSVVEKELASSCNVSEFYLRVKRRVLGLQNSNSTADVDTKDEVIFEDKESEEFVFKEASDKENNYLLSENDERRSHSPSSVSEITNKRFSHAISDNKWNRSNGICNLIDSEVKPSPKFVNDGFSPIQVRAVETENGRRTEEIPHPLRNECIVSESSDSEESYPRKPQVTSRRWRRKLVLEDNKNSEEINEIQDSELSSSSGGIQYRRKRAVFVVGSSESGSPTPNKSIGKDDMDLINDFHESDLEGMNESESEESVGAVQKKQFEELEAEIGKNGSNELLCQGTRKAVVLDGSESPSLGGKFKEPELNPNPKKKLECSENPNLKYQAGFSNLSESKHEDIKRWLNAIPCSNTDSLGSKNAEEKLPNENEENIKLTDMEQVLNELYGNEWLNNTKLTPKAVVRKKSSQIIISRLTDSDDSSTPPLPPSTPKRKLYNVNSVLGTPVPVTRNIFTPLTSIGKKGGRNVYATPKTVDSKAKSTRKYVNSDAFSSPLLTFMASLSVDHNSARCHPEAKYFIKNFKSKKEELARKLFEIFNSKVFSNKLPADLPIIWNNRLRKTAGYCYNRRIKSSDGSFARSSRVELSSKIVDNCARLRDTLVHELCHAATWIISEVTGGHGPTWKRWTYRAMEAFPELPQISRCHNYDIETKFKYKCSGCNYSIGRHSKSLDVERKVCGICGGRFELFVNKKNDNGKTMPSTPRTPNAFALFVKENYGSAKKSKENLKHKDVMKILSEKFAATKISKPNVE